MIDGLADLAGIIGKLLHAPQQLPVPGEMGHIQRAMLRTQTCVAERAA